MPPHVQYPLTLAFVTIFGMAVTSGCDSGSASSKSADSSSADDVAAEAPWFVDECVRTGIEFHHESGHTKRYLMPENVPGGGAVIDFDNDGDLDVYLLQSGSAVNPESNTLPNMLYENLGDGTFRDVTAESGDAAHTGYGMGAACGDYDNDGDTDIYVTNLGPNLLLRNNGDGTFTDVTATAGVGNDAWGTSTAFADIDQDGDLDLYVCNYIAWSIDIEQECFNSKGELDYCAPRNYSAPVMDVLYLNNGDGTFTDITRLAGLDSTFGNGLGIGVADFTGDGLIDFFIANDQTPDQLWVNQGLNEQGVPQFRDESTQRGCAVDLTGIAKAGMGVAIADIDDDRDFDILVCNIQDETDSLHLNENGSFLDATLRRGLGQVPRRFTRFGLGWADFNNDGWLDLYQANGRVGRQQKAWSDDPYAEPNVLFQGQADGTFTEVLPRGGTKDLLIASSRAAIFADLNNDGGMDLIVVNQDAPPNILMNRVVDRGNWVILRVLDEHGRDAHGAVVTVQVNDRLVSRIVNPAYSYTASNDPRVHIGLGKVETLEDISVTWVDGTSQSFDALPANQVHVLTRQ